MVFWKEFPIQTYLDGLFKTQFKSLIFKRNRVDIPNNTTLEIISNRNLTPNLTPNLKKVLREVREFLKSYFGNPPKSPILDIPIEQLLKRNDHILFLRDNTNQIIGCIRYKYLGKLLSIESNPDIYCEDCFCIHPNWRKKGIGDYLLTSLHNYVNTNNIPYSLFLKEGKSLGILHIPLYSGEYVYMKISINNMKTSVDNETKLYKLTNIEAISLIRLFEKVNIHKSLVIINEKDLTQNWLLFMCGIYKILICYQDTYQWIKNEDNEDNKDKRNKMAWITGWFETKDIPINIKAVAIQEILGVINQQFGYVWANSQLIPKECNWKKDGFFHWYSYQWTTNLNLKNNYCITL